MKTVLGVSHSQDESVYFERLGAALRARGARLLRLDADLFPTEVQLHATLEGGRWRGHLRTQEGEAVDLEALHSIWYRRRYIAHGLPKEGLPPAVRRACWIEATAALVGILSSLPIPAVDDPHRVNRAEHKGWQLLMAQRAGLRLPHTLISNDPEGVQAWATGAPSLVTKMLAASELRTPEGAGQINTSAVSVEDLEDLSGLSLAPLTLQHRLDKALEVRAVVVGEQVFAAGVDSRRSEKAAVDWRKGSAELMREFRPVTLPDSVIAALLRLQGLLGLRYGGADLILTPEGQWFFLEINPGGEWAWVQEFAGFDIPGALAELLTR